MIPIIGKKKPYSYDGIEFASKEEIYFRWYLDDLKSAGIVKRFEYQPETLVLSDGAKVVQTVILKTKVKQVERSLFRHKTYTPDYYVFFNNENPASILFHEDLLHGFLTRKPKDIPFLGGVLGCVVDIKPQFERDSARARAFALIQAWLWETYNTFVQPVVYQKLFEQTFTPDRFLLTDKSGKFRVINYPVRTLHDYTHSKAAV